MTPLDHLDWPFFTPAHAAGARALADWAAGQPDRDEDHDPERLGTACRELALALGAAGHLAAAIPENNAEPDIRAFCLAREILAGRHPLTEYVLALQALGSWPILLCGTTRQKRRYLPPARAGTKLVAFALSEPDAGSDAAAVGTLATRTGNGWQLDGVKTWISNGAIADHLVVFARSEAAPGARGLSAFIVERGDPGFSVAAHLRIVAPHPLATLRFDTCRIPADRLLGEPGQGFGIAMKVLDRFRPSVGAAALGLGRRALALALERAADRKLFGSRLGDLPVAQARLGSMATELDAAALLVYRAAWRADTTPGRLGAEAAMAKMQATETADRVIDAAIQLFGGLGVCHGHPVEALSRAIRPMRIYDGATEVLELLVGRSLMKSSG